MIGTILATIYLTGLVLTFLMLMGRDGNYPEGCLGPLVISILWPFFLWPMLRG